MARVRLVALLLAAGTSAIGMLACGGIVGMSQATTDPGPDVSAAVDAAAADVATLAAEASVVNAMDAPLDVRDAAPCLNGTAPDAGHLFSCIRSEGEPGYLACWSGTQFCSQNGDPGVGVPLLGCHPLPCGCGLEPSCACLGLSYLGGAGCSDDDGGIVVWGPNGIQ